MESQEDENDVGEYPPIPRQEYGLPMQDAQLLLHVLQLYVQIGHE
jgi:hypothetical protein